ncbi:SDR family oxidoreductase [Zunongwangia sp. F363]|uniref:SDR family oxidoreductase n=1 Tax=Autumnicola tepida TaxID=3075595 RepID=A0ABU3CC47_9FLAO|nr:SDR family oxidoreductase [Zunongwangia sp. F363]MDT0643913.1 SDR family oxidoreductase [Zunongwangia sp. F363]
MQAGNLSGNILITGGANGIGYAVAKRFSKENYKVAIADIEKPQYEDENIFFSKADISNPKDIDSLYDDVINAIGHPEILVLNAGRGIQEKLFEGDPEKWQKVIDTNLMGALRCIRAFVPQMMERQNGHVIVVSSVSANQPHPSGGIYAASKTALEVIAETLRLETLPHIKVTVVSPGITDTKFFEHQISGYTSVANLEMGSIAPEDIAEDIFYAVNQKGRSINKIITRPLKQSF